MIYWKATKIASGNFNGRERNQTRRQRGDENSKSTKRRKTLNTYTNWFALHHWLSIFAVVKKHGDLIKVLHYLKTFHKKPRKVNVPYEKLSKGFI